MAAFEPSEDNKSFTTDSNYFDKCSKHDYNKNQHISVISICITNTYPSIELPDLPEDDINIPPSGQITIHEKNDGIIIISDSDSADEVLSSDVEQNRQTADEKM